MLPYDRLTQVIRMKMSADEIGERLRQRVVERYRRLPPLQELRLAPEPVRRRSRLAVTTRKVQKPAKLPSVAPAAPARASAVPKNHPNRISHDFLFQRRR